MTVHTLGATVDPTISIVTTLLPSAKSGADYFAQLQASGGSGTYTWSIVSGALPDGLTLEASTGIISGEPTVDADFSFDVRVTSGRTSVVHQITAISVGLGNILLSQPGPPKPESISRDVGSTAGGTVLIITGTDFVDGATIDIGGGAATDVVFDSSTSLTCTTPARAAGLVDIVVTNPSTAAGSLQGQGAYGYEYLPAPGTIYAENHYPIGGGHSPFGTDFNTPGTAYEFWHTADGCGGAACEPTWFDFDVPIYVTGGTSTQSSAAKARKGGGSEGASKLVYDFTGDAIENPTLEATGLYQRWYSMLPENSLAISRVTGSQIKLLLNRHGLGSWLMNGIGTQFSPSFEDEYIAFINDGIKPLPPSTGFSTNATPSRTGFKILANTWHEFQTWYFHDGTTGRTRLWIDGKEMYDCTDDRLGNNSSTAGHRFEIGVAWVQGNDGPNQTSVYIDEPALADGYIEAVGGTPSPDL